MSTIYALSTLMGKSGVAVIRISGSDALKVLPAVSVAKMPAANECIFAEIFDPSTKEQIDQCMIAYFKAPKSFTGEDVVEIFTHGSIAVIEHLLEVLGNLSFLRMAEAGEFARRAFFNSKMDLTMAEGLADLIDAETRIQKKVALAQLNGALESKYDSWRADIISILARLEALIDFPEEDIPASVVDEINRLISNLKKEIELHLKNKSGEVIRRGIKIAIIGQPNAGKSTLLNILANSDVAIVSEISGTTRDVINVKIDLDGYPIQLFDTAGIRQTEDVIEKEGISRAIKVAMDADLVLLVVDGTDASFKIAEFLKDQNYQNLYVLVNKQDDLVPNLDEEIGAFQPMYIAAKSGKGIDILLEKIRSFIQENYSISADPVITRVRYRSLLNKCLEYLNHFNIENPLEISSEIIRQAAQELGHITGKVEVEDVLDKIFSSFCIGK